VAAVQNAPARRCSPRPLTSGARASGYEAGWDKGSAPSACIVRGAHRRGDPAGGADGAGTAARRHPAQHVRRQASGRGRQQGASAVRPGPGHLQGHRGGARRHDLGRSRQSTWHTGQLRLPIAELAGTHAAAER
jgi:hypothetical protein